MTVSKKEKLKPTLSELFHDYFAKTDADKHIKNSVKYSSHGLMEQYRIAAARFLHMKVKLTKHENNTIDYEFSHHKVDDKEAARLAYTQSYNPLIYDHFKDAKVFKFREPLVRKFELTEISKVDAYFLKLPFKSIIITSDELILENTNEIYVAFDETRIAPETNTPYKTLTIVAANNTGNLTETVENPNTQIYCLPIGEGDVLSQIKNSDVENKSVFSFVINALLYLNSSQPDLNPLIGYKSPYEKILRKKGEGNSKLQTPNSKLQTPNSKLQHIAVGDSVTIDRTWSQQKTIMEEADNNTNTNTNTNTDDNKKELQHRLTPAWIVRGHYRNQACGPNREEREIIWIQPYIKGDVSKEVKDKFYDVKI